MPRRGCRTRRRPRLAPLPSLRPRGVHAGGPTAQLDRRAAPARFRYSAQGHSMRRPPLSVTYSPSPVTRLSQAQRIYQDWAGGFRSDDHPLSSADPACSTTAVWASTVSLADAPISSDGRASSAPVYTTVRHLSPNSLGG